MSSLMISAISDSNVPGEAVSLTEMVHPVILRHSGILALVSVYSLRNEAEISQRPQYQDSASLPRAKSDYPRERGSDGRIVK